MKYKRATLKLCGLVAGAFVFAVVMQSCSKPDDTSADTARAACARAVLDDTPGGAVWVNRANWPATRTGYLWRVKVAYETTQAGGVRTYHARACEARQQPSGRWVVGLQP